MGGLSYYEFTSIPEPSTPTPIPQPIRPRGLDLDAIHFIIIYMIALLIMALSKLQ